MQKNILFFVIITLLPIFLYSNDNQDTIQFTLYTKLIVAIISGIGALLGLPLLLLHYKKTKAEIRKLEIDSQTMNSQKINKDIENNQIRIAVSDSKDTSINVIPDPRLAAPLLLLIDFVYAWIVLTLANYFISILDLGFFREIILASLASLLLFPIISEIIHIKASFASDEKKVLLFKTIKTTIYFLWSIFILVLVGLTTALFITDKTNLTYIGQIIPWITGIIAIIFIILIVTTRTYINNKLKSIIF